MLVSRIRWLKDIFKLGIKAPITPDDIYKPKTSLESAKIVKTFIKIWSDELKNKNPSMLRLVFRIYGIRLIFWGMLNGISRTLMKSVKYFYRCDEQIVYLSLKKWDNKWFDDKVQQLLTIKLRIPGHSHVGVQRGTSCYSTFF